MHMASTSTTLCCSNYGYRTFHSRFPACEQNNKHLLEPGVTSDQNGIKSIPMQLPFKGELFTGWFIM